MEALEFKGFGGVPIAASAFGSPDDPPVLLLPSLGQVREFWYGSAEALADAGRYAICVDLRGHGDSAPASDGHYQLDDHVGDLRCVLAALPSRAVVVTSGLGALIAITAVGEGAPDLVAGLALVDANIWIDRTAVERVGGTEERGQTDFADHAQILDRIAAAYPSEPRPALTDRLMAAYAVRGDGRLAWRGDPKAMAPASLIEVAERMTKAVAGIGVPVTLIRGSLNESLSDETIRQLQDLIRGSEVAEIEGAGHYASSDREDDFNEQRGVRDLDGDPRPAVGATTLQEARDLIGAPVQFAPRNRTLRTVLRCEDDRNAGGVRFAKFANSATVGNRTRRFL